MGVEVAPTPVLRAVPSTVVLVSQVSEAASGFSGARCWNPSNDLNAVGWLRAFVDENDTFLVCSISFTNMTLPSYIVDTSSHYVHGLNLQSSECI